MDAASPDHLRSKLSLLVARPLWCAVPLGPHGAVHLGFGGRVPRDVPIPDDSLPEDFRTHAAELALFVECAWRLESATGVIAGSRGHLCGSAAFARDLAGFVGARAESVSLDEATGDLDVRFDGGLRLAVFADRLDARETNWTLVAPDGAFRVHPGGRVSHTRDPRAAPLRLVT